MAPPSLYVATSHQQVTLTGLPGWCEWNKNDLLSCFPSLQANGVKMSIFNYKQDDLSSHEAQVKVKLSFLDKQVEVEFWASKSQVQKMANWVWFKTCHKSSPPSLIDSGFKWAAFSRWNITGYFSTKTGCGYLFTRQEILVTLYF